MDIPTPGAGPNPPGPPRSGVDAEIDLSALDAVLAREPRRRRGPSAGSVAGRPRSAPSAPSAPPVSGRRLSRRTTPLERRLVGATAVAAGLVATTSAAHPTGLALPDVLLRFGFAFVVTLAAARARRSSWLLLGAAGAILAPSGLWLVPAVLGLLAAVASTFVERRRLMGAVVAALTVPAMMHATPFAFTGASAVCVWLAVLPTLVSGYRVSSRRSQERMQKAAMITFLVALGGTLIFGLSVWVAWGDLHAGADDAQGGLAALREGKGSEAAVRLASSADSLGAAHDVVGAWWTAPARLVPLVAQQAEALSVLTDQGRQIAEAGAVAASRADYRQLRYQQGQVDIERVRQLQQPLDRVANILEVADRRFDEVNSPWLAGPVASALDQISSEVRRTAPQADLAAQGASVAPGLLGGNGTRRYFVAFTTPSEQRGLGGFMGNWAELTATDGKLTLSRSGRTRELDAAPVTVSRAITSPADYAARYARFDPGSFFQDVTVSPDLPSVADVIGQLYPKMGGEPIDGVLVVDPYGLAALLNFTGPIDVDGSPEVLTPENAADILVRRQYVEFTSKDERLDFLDQASKKTFERLTTGDIPGPGKIGEVLGPAVEGRHLMFSAVRPEEQALFDRMGATGAFPAAEPDRDFFALTSQNSGNNKIDVFMRREIAYDVSYDPATGREQATATITLHNDAPTSGLPNYVIGSRDPATPTGTNRMYLSFYSPFALAGSRIDGVSQPFEVQRELGYHVYSRYLSVPAGGTVTVVLDLAGSLRSSSPYRLAVAVQPTVVPDLLQLAVTPADGWKVSDSEVVRSDIDRGRASFVGQPGHGLEASITFERP
jgi:hypothetical protein